MVRVTSQNRILRSAAALLMIGRVRAACHRAARLVPRDRAVVV